jgi:hypothetical protein
MKVNRLLAAFLVVAGAAAASLSPAKAFEVHTGDSSNEIFARIKDAAPCSAANRAFNGRKVGGVRIETTYSYLPNDNFQRLFNSPDDPSLS